MSTVYLWSHVGTHVEAPLHYLAEGADTASCPIGKLMGPAIVLDFRAKAVSAPITIDDLRQAGDIKVGDRVLTMTGRVRVTTRTGTHARRHPPPRYAWVLPDYELPQSSIVPCHQDILRGPRGEGQAETTGADNLKTLRLVFALCDSAATGKAISP